MSTPIFEKPLWLERFHAHLRARPIRRAAYWGTACFLLFQLVHFWWGEAITFSRLAADVLAWGAGAVFFYFGMRWWEGRHAG